MTSNGAAKTERPTRSEPGPTRFLPVVEPVWAMQFTPDTAGDVLLWVSRSEFCAEFAGRFLVIVWPSGHREAVDYGDWVVFHHDGSLRVVGDTEFRRGHTVAPAEPSTDEEPPW